MGLRKITFDGSEVLAKDDADVFYHLFSLTPAGIIKGLYSDVAVTAGNNLITLAKGVVCVYGRLILVEANTQIAISLDSIKNGYVVLQVDIPNNLVTLVKLETASGYPVLTQNNLHTTSGIYQFPLARYKKTATSLTLETDFIPTKIEPSGSLITSLDTSLKAYVESNYGVVYLYPYNSDNNIYKYELNTLNLAKCLFVVRLRSGTSIIFPGRTVSSSSLTNISYQQFQVNYYFVIEYVGGRMYLYSSSSDVLHRVEQVMVWR